MQKTLFALSLGFGIIMLAQAAHSSGSNCAERNKIIQSLATKYGETRQGIGLGKNNGVMEIYASEETGTWTILVTLPNGQACLLAAGESFENLSDPLMEESEDA